MVDDADSIINAAKRCVVKMQLPGGNGGFCTGFFAAPGVIVTCRHGTVSQDMPETVAFEWKGQTQRARTWIVPRDLDKIDYSVFRTDLSPHPFLPLHPDASIHDEVFVPAFSVARPFSTGRRVWFDCLWDAEDDTLFLELRDAQFEHGMSGAPLMNLRTHCVCGILKSSRDPTLALGGRAVSARSILQHMRRNGVYDEYTSLVRGSDARLDSEQRRWLWGPPTFPDPGVAWQATLSHCLDAAAAKKPATYFDLSSTRVARILRRLDSLIDLVAKLTPSERHLLVAVVAHHTLCVTDPGDPYREMPGEDTDRPVREAVENTLNIMDTLSDVGSPLPRVPGFHCDLVAALALLGECLDGDRDAISAGSTGITPRPSDGKPSEWLAYLTRRVLSPYRGVIVYQLLVPSAQRSIRDLMMRCAAVHFGLFYQRIRGILCAYGISISMGHSEVVLSTNVQPLPDHVLEGLRKDGGEKAREIRRLEHLGPRDALKLVRVEELLPLPESAVSGTITFTAPTSTACRLHWQSAEGLGGEHTISQRSDPSGRLFLEADQFPAGTRFSWRLEADLGGYFHPLKSGVLRTLTSSEKAEMDRVLRDAPSHVEPVQARLGLRSDVLKAIWQRIAENSASLEDLLLAHTWLSSAFEWSYRNSPDSRLFETYLDTCNWVRDAITLARP